MSFFLLGSISMIEGETGHLTVSLNQFGKRVSFTEDQEEEVIYEAWLQGKICSRRTDQAACAHITLNHSIRKSPVLRFLPEKWRLQGALQVKIPLLITHLQWGLFYSQESTVRSVHTASGRLGMKSLFPTVQALTAAVSAKCLGQVPLT